MVFDGPESPGMATHLGGVEIVWSGSRSADEVITKRIAAIVRGQGRQGAKSWTVVTNDQTLARRCRDHGAKVEPASIFAQRTTQPKAKSKAARSAQAAADKPAPQRPGHCPLAGGLRQEKKGPVKEKRIISPFLVLSVR